MAEQATTVFSPLVRAVELSEVPAGGWCYAKTNGKDTGRLCLKAVVNERYESDPVHALLDFGDGSTVHTLRRRASNSAVMQLMAKCRLDLRPSLEAAGRIILGGHNIPDSATGIVLVDDQLHFLAENNIHSRDIRTCLVHAISAAVVPATPKDDSVYVALSHWVLRLDNGSTNDGAPLLSWPPTAKK